jgi:Svf1-like C-terminal lipocalin-like domain/Svf1-like N-terminal lipocalin domain
LKIGDSYSYYGEDHNNPWGYMRHIFWPRTHVTGSVIANGHVIDVKGLGMYVHAVQGMKPHHCANKWNFGNFQGKNVSAVMWEFVTPPSYGSQVVNIGGIVKEDGTLVAAMVENAAIHPTTKKDPETGWDAPTSLELSWMGQTKDGVEVTATTESDLEHLVERVDVLAEIPPIIKAFIAGVAGTKPFIYQVSISGIKLIIVL